MPERAIIPLGIAIAAGFFAGVMGAVMQLTGGAALTLGAVCGVVCVAAGALSTVKAPGVPEDRYVVGALRAGLALAVFAFTYAAMLAFLRDGKVLLALLLLLVAAGFGLVFAPLRVRNAPPKQRGGTPHAA